MDSGSVAALGQLLLTFTLLAGWRGAREASAGSPRCTYALVVPPGSGTGASCWIGSPHLAPVGLNASELQGLRALRAEVGRQQAQIEELQWRAGTGKGPGPGSWAQRVAAQYRQLESRYQALAGLVKQQSVAIARLEWRCQGAEGRRNQEQGLPIAPVVPGVPSSPAAGSLEGQGEQGTAGEPQQDQNERRDGSLASTPLSPTPPPGAPTKESGPRRDCLEVQQSGQESSGVYVVHPHPGHRPVPVWCDQQHEGGGWTLIQRRQDGSVNFFTTWQEYKHGFGSPEGEHWLGLETLHQLTKRGDHELLVLLEDWQGRWAHARYSGFSVEPESDHYRLRLGRYHGNAGDSLSWHSDKQFTTQDRDHDAYAGNCAHYHKGGWWYHTCAHSNLNGIWYRGGHYRSRFQDGVYWAAFRGGAYSLKRVAMMVRPS
ncbi:angiopoietin-related protein 6 [Tachyglossus aculeatus]|uniref:angiopoietin-related protein 6 n=1 Tax=Tachyglossus aculeatus TaxID=9261 RepID=UPI0018F4C0C9|nr:angiopoietin-related protein 6 [Tachyglossus aculeatus]